MYHGICDAKGIPITQPHLESMLTFGPAILRGICGIYNGAVIGSTGGAIVGGALGANLTERMAGIIIGAGGGAATGAALGAATIGTLSTVKGGLQTLIGYGGGYILGSVLR